MFVGHVLLLIFLIPGLCQRRHWPDPLYESYKTSSGYTCTVRVNNREYQTDAVYESESLARENAAMRAYMICLNFSANDGMYPVGHKHGGMMQGLPVAIGTGRRSTYTDDGSSGSHSGGSSPGSYESSRSTDDGRRSKAVARALVYGSR